MSNYREQYIVKPENVNKNIFKYYVGKVQTYADSNQYFYCPICQHSSSPRYSWEKNEDIKKCFPHKRVVISGFLFWKKRCPIEGLHTHYVCKICKLHTIKHNEIANSLIFAEAPFKD